ncbi:MAG: bifunctional diaminohydroxyphosphoribosylaminopyrimidine deaminase/5-amino-6-(5-phosphoribosylamino)uracil reductase RibD, partial [Synergistaceae bacterium]|nr:bifunctional diaminohydroxyphosphoribosylaminopyrimidine deaminase/5-amino-6-(5-phosphoribosylamino)uracil reductase RibD [Synergistaceae bacterium]
MEVPKISHDIYMKRALALASLGLKRTSPNPLVGCVIVKDNIIIGEGWHHEYGKSHAEIEALNDAKTRGEDVRGSTVYVTLEPCSHYGKTPPCANRLVQEGVAEVVIAMRDPNPKVDGRGINILREAGIKVVELKVFEREAKFLNRGFIFVHKYSRPFVTLKAAMSLDGKMCLANGSSKWLTGILARTKAHEIRAENDAVLVGVNTVLSDNPELTVRNVKGINPVRVILDARLSTPPDAKVIGRDGKCIILTSENADDERMRMFEDKGVKVFRVSGEKSRLSEETGEKILPEKRSLHINLKSALSLLASQGILTLMVEGGPEVLSSFLREGLADYMNLFFAPRLLGEGRGFNLNMNFSEVKDAFALTEIKTCQFG